MAPHSSVLAWRIPGTGEPGGLPDVYGVTQSRIRLKRLSSSSSGYEVIFSFFGFIFHWWLIMLSSFSCVFDNLYIFFGDNQILCLSFNWVIFLFLLCKFFIHSEYYTLTRHMIYKYSLSFCGLCFYSLDSILWCKQFLILMKSNSSIFPHWLLILLMSYLKNHCQIQTVTV